MPTEPVVNTAQTLCNGDVFSRVRALRSINDNSSADEIAAAANLILSPPHDVSSSHLSHLVRLAAIRALSTTVGHPAAEEALVTVVREWNRDSATALEALASWTTRAWTPNDRVRALCIEALQLEDKPSPAAVADVWEQACRVLASTPPTGEVLARFVEKLETYLIEFSAAYYDMGRVHCIILDALAMVRPLPARLSQLLVGIVDGSLPRRDQWYTASVPPRALRTLLLAGDSAQVPVEAIRSRIADYSGRRGALLLVPALSVMPPDLQAESMARAVSGASADSLLPLIEAIGNASLSYSPVRYELLKFADSSMASDRTAFLHAALPVIAQTCDLVVLDTALDLAGDHSKDVLQALARLIRKLAKRSPGVLAHRDQRVRGVVEQLVSHTWPQVRRTARKTLASLPDEPTAKPPHPNTTEPVVTEIPPASALKPPQTT